MSKTTNADTTDDEERITLSEAIERSSPAQSESFERIADALDDADDSYYAEVVYEDYHGVSFVYIESDEWYGNEGELGILRFRVRIGPRGGLQRAEVKDEFTGTRRELKKPTVRVRTAWKKLLSRIRRAE